MRNRLTLRLRLTLWYSTVLGIILLLFAGFLYAQVRRGLYAQVDAGLQLAAGQALIGVVLEDGLPAFRLDSGNRDVLQQLSHDFVIYLVAADGRRLDAISSDDQPPIVPFQPGPDTQLFEGDPWRVYGRPLPAEYGQATIVVAQELDPLLGTLAALRAQLLWALPLALLLAGVGGYFLASRALRPIERISRTAELISAGDMSGRIQYQGPADEVGRLAATFDAMLDRLQAAFDRERRFTADAAHELRTPLTTLKGRIGVTLSRPRSPQEYEETLHSLESEVDRLVRLSKDLLFIARLDHAQISRTAEPVRVSELLTIAAAQLQPLAEARAVTLQLNSPDALEIVGDVELLIRLVLNLLDNAVKFSPDGGLVTVSAQEQDGRVQLAVSDNGPGIAREHLPHLFERFYRAESGRERGRQPGAPGGTGLGLAIAYEIVRAHGGEIGVESEPGAGTTVRVSLPAAGS